MNDIFQQITTISRVITIIALIATIILLTLTYIKTNIKSSKNVLKCTFKKNHANGIIFGKQGLKYIYSPTTSEGHIFVGGGSGTGKTSALLIPSLRNWTGHAFVFDISGDISKNIDTASKIIYEPLSPQTIPFNIFAPIDYMNNDFDRIEALAQLAWLIMPELKHSSANADYFQNGGRAILTASLIWGYHTGLDFVDICDIITDNSYASLFSKIDNSKDNSAIRYINQFQGNSDTNIAGCKQNADRAISLFATNQKVKQSIRRPKLNELSFSCYSIEDYSVYILIPDAKLELLSPLLHIITAQQLNYLADRSSEKTLPILLALDEFVSLGKLDINPALRKLRKKHIRIMVLTQSMADIDELYTRESRMSMMNNFSFKVILSAGDTDSQKYYSDLIGQEDKTHISTTSGSLFNSRELTKTKSIEKGYIIEPSELASLGDELILLYPGGVKRLHKNFYFK